MDFEKKYLKYKNKYLNQKGGGNNTIPEQETLRLMFTPLINKILDDLKSLESTNPENITKTDGMFDITLLIYNNPPKSYLWNITYDGKTYKYSQPSDPPFNPFNNFYKDINPEPYEYNEQTPRRPGPIVNIFKPLSDDQLKALTVVLNKLERQKEHVVDSESNSVKIKRSEEALLEFIINNVTYKIRFIGKPSTVLTYTLLKNIIIHINSNGYKTTAFNPLIYDDVTVMINSTLETTKPVNFDKPVKPTSNWPFFNPFRK